MNFPWLKSTFLSVWKFLQIKERGPSFWWEPVLKKVWIIWSPLLYFNFKSFEYWIYSSFIRFHYILHDSGVFKSLQIKEGTCNFWREPIWQKVWIIWSPLLYSNFKIFKYRLFLSFISFQCVLDDTGLLFSELWNFYKVKRGYLISWGNQFCIKPDLFGSPFSISILKVLGTEFVRHSLDFNALCMIQEYLSQSLQTSTS